MKTIIIESGVLPGNLLKQLLMIRDQHQDAKVIINVTMDGFQYLTNALAYKDVLKMFHPDGRTPLDIEMHIKCACTQFIMLATASLPKNKVYVGEGVSMRWVSFNEFVWGTESEQEDMLDYYNIVEDALNNTLTSAYGLGLEEIKLMTADGIIWEEDDLISAIDAQELEESPSYNALPSKLDFKPAPIVVFDTDFYPHVASKFINEIDMYRLHGLKDITVIINSPGGCVFSLFSMLGARKRAGNVKVIAIGLAASAGGAFLSSAPKGHRYASQDLVFMIHQFRGGSKRTSFENSRELGTKLADIIHTNSSISRDKLEEMLKRDTFLSAQQALEYGFIDGIIGSA